MVRGPICSLLSVWWNSFRHNGNLHYHIGIGAYHYPLEILTVAHWQSLAASAAAMETSAHNKEGEGNTICLPPSLNSYLLLILVDNYATSTYLAGGISVIGVTKLVVIDNCIPIVLVPDLDAEGIDISAGSQRFIQCSNHESITVFSVYPSIAFKLGFGSSDNNY